MNQLMRAVSKEINRRSGRINHVFGGSYKWCLVQEQYYFEHLYRYIYQNPLKSKLVARVEDYHFSTFHYILHKKKLAFPIYDQELIELTEIPKDLSGRLKWLNEVFTDQQTAAIELGLRKSIFRFPRHKRFRKVVRTFRNCSEKR